MNGQPAQIIFNIKMRGAEVANNDDAEMADEQQQQVAGKMKGKKQQDKVKGMCANFTTWLDEVEAKQAELSCKAWLEKVLALFGGKVEASSASICSGSVQADGDKNIFPLKIREPMILEANNFLRAKGLFPEDNGDSDDEMVFGDDDFPS